MEMQYKNTCLLHFETNAISLLHFSFRFGPLIWRTSKERKRMNKAARSAKCNSGDSGIQIEVL